MFGLKYKKNAMNKIKRGYILIEGGVSFIDAACLCGVYTRAALKLGSGTNNRQVAEPSGTMGQMLKIRDCPGDSGAYISKRCLFL